MQLLVESSNAESFFSSETLEQLQYHAICAALANPFFLHLAGALCLDFSIDLRSISKLCCPVAALFIKRLTTDSWQNLEVE